MEAAASIGFHVNAHKTEYMCFNQIGNISTLNGSSLKLVDKFTYLGSSVSSTENGINMRLAKIWTAIDRLSIIWKSDRTDKMKRSFFQAAVVSILLYGCTTWTLTKRREKKLDSDYTRMLRAILNKSWRQHPTKQQLYGHLSPITKTIKIGADSIPNLTINRSTKVQKMSVDSVDVEQREPSRVAFRTRSKTTDAVYLSLPPTRHDLTQGQKPEGQLKWG